MMVKPKILIIDDEPDHIELIERALTKDEYDFFRAHEGELGLQLFNAHQPTLVLLDLRLPGIEGFELLEKIDLGPDSPSAAIVLTAYGENYDFSSALDKGVTAFIRKPFNENELRVLVKNTIALKQAQIAQKKLRQELDEREGLFRATGFQDNAGSGVSAGILNSYTGP